MKLYDDIFDLVKLAKEESDPDRIDDSDEYKELENRVMNKALIIDELEKDLGCSLDIVIKAITHGIAYELKNGLIESEPHIDLTECGYGYILCSGASARKIIENGEFQTKDYKKTW